MPPLRVISMTPVLISKIEYGMSTAYTEFVIPTIADDSVCKKQPGVDADWRPDGKQPKYAGFPIGNVQNVTNPPVRISGPGHHS